VQEAVEKLRATSEIAALVAGFAVVGMLDFSFNVEGAFWGVWGGRGGGGEKGLELSGRGRRRKRGRRPPCLAAACPRAGRSGVGL